MASELVEVQFQPSSKLVWVRRGSTLLEAAAAAELEILTGCTRGMCGTDAVRVLAGAAGLEQPAETERGTLERMGLGTDYRLSCSAVVLAGPVTIQTDSF